MNTLWRTAGGRAELVLTVDPALVLTVDPAHEAAVRGLSFSPVEGGFAESFPADAPRLGDIYRQFARSAEDLVRQAAGAGAVRWDLALLAAIGRTRRAGVDDPHPSDFGPAAAERLETVSWRGHDLRVPPLEMQRQVSLRRGLGERVRQVI